MNRHNDSDSELNESQWRDDGMWTQVAQRHYDPDQTQDLVTSIIGAIAEARGVDITQVTSPPLYDSVDTEALEDTFFGRTTRGQSRMGVGTVEFPYEEFLVSVRSDGWVQVYESPAVD